MEIIGVSGIFLICAISIAIHIQILRKLGIESLGKSKDQIEADFLGVHVKRRSYKSISHSQSVFGDQERRQQNFKIGQIPSTPNFASNR